MELLEVHLEASEQKEQVGVVKAAAQHEKLQSALRVVLLLGQSLVGLVFLLGQALERAEEEREEPVVQVVQVEELGEVVLEDQDTGHSTLSSFDLLRFDQDRVYSIQRSKMEHKRRGS